MQPPDSLTQEPTAWQHEWSGDGTCRRCSADSQSSGFSDPCKVPPGHTIFDNPDAPHNYGPPRPMTEQERKRGR